MELNKRKVLYLICLIIANSLSAISLAEAYDSLLEKYEKVQSFQADIEQTSYYSEIEYTNVAKGKIYYTQNRLLIDYFEPNQEKICLNDNIVHIYQSKEDRLIISKADSSFISLNLGKLIKDVWLEDNAVIEDNNNFYRVKIDTRKNNNLVNISMIEFEIDKKDNLIKAISYQDESDNSVRILFSNVLLNDTISSEIWELDVSSETEIIDYRE